tara:strand:- start:82 stop:222 length:141 start_codon:yes stop_codon:yes gene_type:complete
MGYILKGAVNTIDFSNVAMDKLIKDDPKVKKFVDATIDHCANLVNP